MYIDIHRHSADKGKADLVMRNLFHNETSHVLDTRFCSVGLHPWHVNKETLDEDLKCVNDAAGLQNVIALGETGIDKAISVDHEIQGNNIL